MFNKMKSTPNGCSALAAAPIKNWAAGSSLESKSRPRRASSPINNKGSTLTPSGLAENESNHKPPQTAVKAMVKTPWVKLA